LNKNENEKSNVQKKSPLIEEKQTENSNVTQNQNSDYKKIYENIKKIKHDLYLLEIFRIIMIILMAFCIYFDIFKSENSKIMFISTFMLLETSLFLAIRSINGNKVILNLNILR